MTRYYLFSKDNPGQSNEFETAEGLSVFLLGRSVDRFVIIKEDEKGMRLWNFRLPTHLIVLHGIEYPPADISRIKESLELL